MAQRTVDEVAQETLQRVIRTETRLVTLGAKLGHDLKDDEDIDVNFTLQEAHLKTLDVALSAIIKVARRAGLHGHRVAVYFEESKVAEVLA